MTSFPTPTLIASLVPGLVSREFRVRPGWPERPAPHPEATLL